MTCYYDSTTNFGVQQLETVCQRQQDLPVKVATPLTTEYTQEAKMVVSTGCKKQNSTSTVQSMVYGPSFMVFAILVAFLKKNFYQLELSELGQQSVWVHFLDMDI